MKTNILQDLYICIKVPLIQLSPRKTLTKIVITKTKAKIKTMSHDLSSYAALKL